MIGKLYRATLAVCLAIFTSLAPVAPALAQQEPSAAPAQPQPGVRVIPVSNLDYSQGKPWYPHILEPYRPLSVPEPVLTNAPKIEEMIQYGKLRISLQDAIDLALQNNLDIAIERYSPWIAEANILRTMGGGVSKGAQTPLGNIPFLNFDPVVTSTLGIDSRRFPVNNPQSSGAGTPAGTFAQLATHSAIGDVAYTQGFHTGTSFAVSFVNTRASSTSLSNFFSPSFASTMTISASQQLLNGFGVYANEHNILLAKINKSLADQTFAQQVLTSITAVSNAYWELVFARGNVDVAQHEIELANKLYSDNKKQVDVGTLAPLEIVQAEAQVATSNQALIVAQTTLLQNQLTLLNLIAKDPTSPALRTVEIIPTDNADVPPPEVEKIPLEDAIREAITKRPDVLQAGTTLKGDDVNVRATKNALLPILTLSGYYAAQGLAGDNKLRGPVTTVAGAQAVDVNGNPLLVLTSPTGVPVPIFIPTAQQAVTGVATSGPASALGDMFRGVYPEFNAQINLTIPIRNRQAQADNATALLISRQDETRYRQTVNNVATDVHNAQIVLEQARATVAAAVKTRDLDAQTLDAEQKKYQLGASTLFNIVSDQNILAAAASAEVRARINLAEAKVNFDRAVGRTLEVNNITIANAKSGKIPKDTLIPGTSATGELISDQNVQPASSVGGTSLGTVDGASKQ
jgi:outer membrane protein